MASRKEVEKLKNDWVRDPCWDLEETEGFESFREELLVFRDTCEARWEEQDSLRLLKLAKGYGIEGQPAVAGLIERLSQRISELEGKVGLIRSDVFCKD